jgi:ribosomal protein S18 acetylase RimI-like enzyme
MEDKNMSEPIKVRFANPSDASELSKLNYDFNGVLMLEEKIVERLETDEELVVVGLKSNKIVGFACAQSFKSFCYETLQGEITEMYVIEQFRGQGTATSMVDLLEEGLKERGVKSVKILTGQDNSSALRAYRKKKYEDKEWAVMYKKLK